MKQARSTPLTRLASLALLLAVPACAPDSGLDDDWEEAAEAEGALRVCADGATTEGIDVSYHQGTIDWAKVATTKAKFAIVRASYGSGFTDPKFAENWAGAKSAGLVRGLYQYFRPSQDAEAQAQLVLELLHDDPLGPDDLPVVLDVEELEGLTKTKLRQRMRVWLDAIEQGTGKKPIIYTAAFMQDAVGTEFADYPLWAANYTTKCPLMPTGWNEWAFWQYTDSGKIAGISGDVDRNRFNGSLDELFAFAQGAGSTPAPPPDDPPPDDPPAPPPPADPAGAPTNLAPANGSSIATDSVTLSCSSVKNATSYGFDIEHYKPNVGWKPYYQYTEGKPSKTFWPAWDAAYRYRIRARVGGAWKPYSNYRTFAFGSASLP